MIQADLSFIDDFYSRPLGQRTRRLLAGVVNEFLGNTTGQNILCCGYGFPYLEPMVGIARSSLAFMPAAMGVRRWPGSASNCAALVEPDRLPLPDSSFDAVLVIHSLEFSPDPEKFLGEIWRVLVPSGSAVVVVPNRRGIWSHSDHTPFGYGQPFTRRQLARIMENSSFRLLKSRSALYSPPFEGPQTQRLHRPAEAMGRTLWRNFAGVLVQAGEKQLLSGEAITTPAMSLAAVRPAHNV